MSVFDKSIDCKNEHCKTNFVPDTEERREAGYCKTCQPQVGGPIAEKPIAPENAFVWKQDKKLHQDILRIFNEEILPYIIEYVDEEIANAGKKDTLTECATPECTNTFEKKSPAQKYCDECKADKK